LIKDSGAGFDVGPHTLATNLKGVFAGGDMINGPTSVIQAVASGRKAALSIDKHLRGENIEIQHDEPSIIGIEAIDVEMLKKRGRKRIPERGVYDEDAALAEADRCFQCGMFPKK
jgi:hypothetical protein